MSQKKYKVKSGYRWLYTIVRRDKDGKRCDFSKGGFRTKREAKVAEAKKRELFEYEKNNPIKPEDIITVDELFIELMQNKKDMGTQEQTLNGYRNQYNRWFKNKIGDRAIKQITSDEIQELFDKMAGNFLSLELPMQILRNIYKLAIQKDIVNRNVAEGIILKKNLLKKRGKLKDDYMQSEEIKKFFIDLSEFLGEKKRFINSRDMLMYYLLLNTGIRVGEAMALRWSDVNFNYKTININKTQIKLGNKFVEGDSTKTKESVRIIPVLNDDLWVKLKDWKNEQKELIEIREKELTDDLKDLIFYDMGKVERLRTSFYTEALTSFYKKYPEKTKSKIKSHGLRHTFTTIVRKAECDKEKVAEYLGHTQNKTMTDRYTHIDPIGDLMVVAEIANEEIQKIFM